MDGEGESGASGPHPSIALIPLNPSSTPPVPSSSPARIPQTTLPQQTDTPPQSSSVPHEYLSSSPSHRSPMHQATSSPSLSSPMTQATHSPHHDTVTTETPSPQNVIVPHEDLTRSPPQDPQNSPLNTDQSTYDSDALPVPSAPTLPPSPALEHLPIPSAPIAEEEDVSGTTPYPATSPEHIPQSPPKYEEMTMDTPDSIFPHAVDHDLPRYSPSMAPSNAQGVLAPEVGSEGVEGRRRLRPRDVRVGVNLVRAGKRLLKFLATVDAHGGLYRGELVEKAIIR